MDRHANNLLVSRVSFSGGGAFECCYSHSRGAFECCSDSRGAFECCSDSRGTFECCSDSRGAFECCSDSRGDSNCCSHSCGDSIHSTTHNHPIHATNNSKNLSHPRTCSVDGDNSLSPPRDNYTGYARASNPAYRSQSTTSEMVTPALRLVPIDHGYALPRTSTTQVPEWCWMQWYHSKQPVTAAVRAHGHPVCSMCSMKTSFFKRKPDLHSATIEYFAAGSHLYIVVNRSTSVLRCSGSRERYFLL